MQPATEFDSVDAPGLIAHKLQQESRAEDTPLATPILPAEKVACICCNDLTQAVAAFTQVVNTLTNLVQIQHPTPPPPPPKSTIPPFTGHNISTWLPRAEQHFSPLPTTSDPHIAARMHAVLSGHALEWFYALSPGEREGMPTWRHWLARLQRDFPDRRQVEVRRYRKGEGMLSYYTDKVRAVQRENGYSASDADVAAAVLAGLPGVFLEKAQISTDTPLRELLGVLLEKEHCLGKVGLRGVTDGAKMQTSTTHAEHSHPKPPGLTSPMAMSNSKTPQPSNNTGGKRQSAPPSLHLKHIHASSVPASPTSPRTATTNPSLSPSQPPNRLPRGLWRTCCYCDEWHFDSDCPHAQNVPKVMERIRRMKQKAQRKAERKTSRESIVMETG